MDLIKEIIEKAKAHPQHIVLPEGTEERTLRAANDILRDKIARITLIGKPNDITNKAKEFGLEHIHQANLIDPSNHPKRQAYIDLLVELRKSKGMTQEQAEQLVNNPLYLACLMIKAGDADGELAGAINSTGDVLRPALQIIKTAPGFSSVSGLFLMFTPQHQYGKDGLLFFADCAVIPNPTAAELAQVAIASAGTAQAIAGVDPKVAILSFSTKGSAMHEMVDKVIEAGRLAKELAPNLAIDSELQADAALVQEIARLKAPQSEVAGQANILVFPSLEVGNISYKLVQRLAGAEAIGPLLQGMAAPVNDLSRGCSQHDIYNMVAITAVQAIGSKGLL